MLALTETKLNGKISFVQGYKSEKDRADVGVLMNIVWYNTVLSVGVSDLEDYG